MLVGKAKYREEYPVYCTWRSLASDSNKIPCAFIGCNDKLIKKKKFSDIFQQIRTISNV